MFSELKLNIMTQKFDFKDITLVPEVISTINSRKEINIFNENGKLPIMVSPMDTVVNLTNYQVFLDNKLEVCLPRGLNPENFNGITSVSLDIFENFIDWYTEVDLDDDMNILIDIANGHMEKLYTLVKKFMEIRKTPNHKLYIGNIANPKTYEKFAKLGIDGIRVGIGGGCFISNTKVKTITGFKNIIDININDMVLTHTGEYKKVLKTIKKEWSEDLIKINNEITCTKDHKFYVLNKKYLNEVNDENLHILCEWVSVEELKETGEYLLVQQIENTHDS